MDKRIAAVPHLVPGRDRDDAFILGVLLCAVFQLYIATDYFTLLFSGTHPNDPTEYNPVYGMTLLGLCAILLGKLISFYQTFLAPAWLRNYLIAWCLLSWAVGIVLFNLGPLLWFSPRLFAYLSFLAPVLLIAQRFQQSSGVIAPLLVQAGCGVIIVGGLGGVVIEMLAGRSGSQLTGVVVTFSLSCAVAATDFLVGVRNGHLISPFVKPGSFYYDHLDRGLIQVGGYFLGLLIILYGQGQIAWNFLRNIPYFHLLNSLPYYDLFFAAGAAGVHYAIWRKIKKE